MTGLIELRKKGNGVKVMEFKKTHELHKVERIEDSIPESGHDRITGFYDRTCSEKMIETYIQENAKENAAIYMMDIDGFHNVQENQGMLFGEEVIKEIAEILKEVFQENCVLGRVGEDKFVVCDCQYDTVEEVEEKAKIICRKVHSVYIGENQDYNLSISIGIALYPEQSNVLEDIFAFADQTLTSVKQNGKDGYDIYSSFIGQQNLEGRILEGKFSAIHTYAQDNIAEGLDSFGYELIDLALRLMEDTRHERSAINLLMRKIAMHYDMDAISIKVVVDKPKTLRYEYEYLKNMTFPPRVDFEWQYTDSGWETILNSGDNRGYLYYRSQNLPFEIPELENDTYPFSTFYEIPMLHGGKFIGCLEYIYFDQEKHFTESEKNTLKMFSKVISAYLLNIKNNQYTTQKIEQLSDHDALTGLMKYDVFCKKLKRQVSKGFQDRYIVIMYSDLKHFKYINETYGYDVGNRLLRQFCVRTTRDVKGLIGAARVYSDNIVMAAEYPCRITDEQIYQEVVKQNQILNHELQETFMDNNINICTGIFVIKNSKVDVEIAVSNANMARKEAKKQERNTVVLFDNEMMESVVRQMQLNAELPEAIRNHEIKVYYQPKIESGTGKIVGGEALVRWQKEDGTFVYPDQFIPGFEENGMIIEIDYYVYETVFRQIKERLDQNLPVVPISMNISRVHLNDDEFFPYIQYLFNKYQVSAEYIEFELTESIYIENLERALGLIRDLRKMGIKISMDDFGSGYSSLNVLNNLPIDILKLDKIFLDGTHLTVNQQIIISCVVEMAAKLNIQVICEGVETEEQAKFLTVIGCDMIQGYYYAKPLPDKEFFEYVDKHIKVKSKVICFTLDGTLADTTGKYCGTYIGEKEQYTDSPFEGQKALLMVGGSNTSNVLDIPTGVFMNSSYTVSCWAKVSNKRMWSSLVFLNFENGFASLIPYAVDFMPDMRIKLTNEDENVWHDTGATMQIDDDWHFYAITYNAQTRIGIFYIDDKIAGFMENVPMLVDIQSIVVGGDIYAKSFEGSVSRVTFYNQSLSKYDVYSAYTQEAELLSQNVKDARTDKHKAYNK